MKYAKILRLILLDTLKIFLIALSAAYLVKSVGYVQELDELRRKKADALSKFNMLENITIPELKKEIAVVKKPEPEKHVEISEPDLQASYVLADDEYELLSHLVTAEAEGEGFEVQYMVACVVMNRVKSEYFPDSVTEVIWQKEPVIQFSSMWNGRYERCSTTDSCYEAVGYMAKHGNELPDDVLYFTSCGYIPGTVPYIQVGNMFFSRQEGME